MKHTVSRETFRKIMPVILALLSSLWHYFIFLLMVLLLAITGLMILCVIVFLTSA